MVLTVFFQAWGMNERSPTASGFMTAESMSHPHRPRSPMTEAVENHSASYWNRFIFSDNFVCWDLTAHRSCETAFKAAVTFGPVVRD